MPSLTWEQVLARRLARSHLLEPLPAGSLALAAAGVCGIQAQVSTAAELALAARVENVGPGEVRTALEERRSLVKAPTLRGTLHLHPAGELGLWSAVRCVHADWRDPRRLAAHGLEPAGAEELRLAIGEALRGRCLTREELGSAVAAALGGRVLRDSPVIQFGGHQPVWSQLLGAAADTGLLCYGPLRGGRVTFVSPDDWLGQQRRPEPQAALEEACLRFLGPYGPATPAELAHWLALPPAAVRSALARLGGRLAEVDVEGTPRLVVAGDDGAPAASARSLRLLGAYDCLVIGGGPPGEARDRLLPPAAAGRVFDRGAGPAPVLLLDGRVAGVWSRARRGRRLEVRVEPFEPLASGRLRALEAEARRVGELFGAVAELVVP